MIVLKGALRRALKSLVRIFDSQDRKRGSSQVDLSSDGSMLHLRCTNESTNFSTSIACDGCFSGRVCATELLAFISPYLASERTVPVEFLESQDGRVVVAMGEASVELPLATIPPTARRGVRDLEQPWRHIATWRGAEFSEGVAWVLRALGRDPSRPQLRNVLFEGRECVATDGHRLHSTKLEANVAQRLLMDGNTLATFLEVVTSSDEVTVARSGDRLWMRVRNWSLETSQPRVEFPQYAQVVPSEGVQVFSVTAARTELLRAVGRFISHRKRGGVRLVVNGLLTIEKKTERGTTSVAPRIVGTTHTGPNSEFGIDPAYLADALASGGDEVALRFGDSLSPICCDLGHGRVGVVMPIRL